MKRSALIILIIFLMLFVGCTGASHTFTEEEARNYIKEAVIDLNKISNFETTSNVQIQINGTVTDTKTANLVSHSSGEYDVSTTEEKNGSQQNAYHRAIINSIIYEFNAKKGSFDEMPIDQSLVSPYDLYESDRSMIFDFINQIYNQNSDKLGDFLTNLSLVKETKDKNGPIFIFSYKNYKEANISNITQSGEIYVSHYNGELIISGVKDTYHVVFKKNGMVADTITDISINNIENARTLNPPSLN
jgi:hypothetical protein